MARITDPHGARAAPRPVAGRPRRRCGAPRRPAAFAAAAFAAAAALAASASLPSRGAAAAPEGAPLVVVVEGARNAADATEIRAVLAVVLARPTLSAADAAAARATDRLLVVLTDRGRAGVLTRLEGDRVEVLSASGPAGGAVPAWLPTAAATLFYGEEAVARWLDRPFATTAGAANAAEATPAPETPASWRLPREVLDPFDPPAREAPRPLIAYELLDPWRRGDVLDPWAPRVRGDDALGLTPPPPPR